MKGSFDFNPYGVMCSAYRNQNGQWVAVAINYSEQPQHFTLRLSDDSILQWQMYRTSDQEGETLMPIGIMDGNTSLPPRSITTFVSQ